MKKLKKQNHNKERIKKAKFHIERIIFQLNTIISRQTMLSNSNENIENNIEQQNISIYRNISNKIDIKKVMRFMIVLEKEFGSMEKVFNEYLYSLQIGIDLEMYLIDKKAYKKKKATESIEIDTQSIITVEKIEAKLLYIIEKQRKDEEELNDFSLTKDKLNMQQGSIIDAQVAKPKEALQDIMKEIDAIKNQGYNMINIENEERMRNNHELFKR